MNKKQFITFFLIAFFVGALGSIVFGRYIIPYLATLPGFSSLNKLATTAPIVINRREEVQLNEGVNLIDLVKQAGNITATVYTSSGGELLYVANGIVVSSDGLIFTSRQAGGKPGNLVVVLNDGRSFPATVGPIDPRSDLMILKIEAENLTVAQFEEARSLQAGQRLIGIGPSAREFIHKFITGFVTNTVSNNASLDRVYLTQAFEETIDIDAQISDEYFGGPLINLQGKVVGMMANTNSNILPAENLQTALTSFLSTGKIIRPHFGARYLSLSAELAALSNLPQAGISILQVDKGSPAAEAGLLAKDFIFEVDGQNLNDNTFEYLLNRHSISDMKIKVWRNENTIELTVRLEPI